MVELYTFPETFGLRNVSPFCLKVEMALTHIGIEYQIVEEKDPRNSPKGKLPYIVLDGESIADSEIILEHLDKTHNGVLYGSLTDAEYAQGYAFTRLAEDHLYWLLVASRWLDDEWFLNIVNEFFDFVSQGNYANETVVPSVRSNLTAVMGRMAGYSGGEITWNEMLDKGERLELDLIGLKSG